VSYAAPSVLVVDDDPSVRSLIVDVLEIEGYTVRAAEDGFAALRSVADTPPDCVVLDVMMPGLDGHDVLRVLRSQSHGTHVPVVMLTAASDNDSVWRGWSNGVTQTTPTIQTRRIDDGDASDLDSTRRDATPNASDRWDCARNASDR